MTSFVSHLTFDCRDAYALSAWWAEVLGYRDIPDDPNEPGHEECFVIPAEGEDGVRLLFIQVPEGKQVKNRLHLDLRPRGDSREEELARLLELGASQLGDLRRSDGSGWVVLADPEGNEFCILRSEAEVAAAHG